MKIYAFAVEQHGRRTLRELIEAIYRLPLGDRAFLGAAGPRLEAANLHGDLVYADFARARFGHGPGKMGRHLPLEDIPLEEGAMFGEDTGVVFDPATGFAAVQFNQYGPRASTIAQYLTAADLHLGVVGGAHGFELHPRLRPDAFARLQDFQLVRELSFTVHVPGVNRADFDAGRSVGSILRGPLPSGLQELTVTMKASRGRGSALALDAVRAALMDLEQMGGELVGGVVKGKRTPDDKTVPVDLVDERLSKAVTIAPGRGQRFDRADRWSALRFALQDWRETGQLQ